MIVIFQEIHTIRIVQSNINELYLSLCRHFEFPSTKVEHNKMIVWMVD